MYLFQAFCAVEDEESVRLQQEQRMYELYDACCASGHELLLEIIPPAGDVLGVGESVCRSAQRVYDLGIRPDWWKVPCMPRASVGQLDAIIVARAPQCRGIVVLGLDAPIDELGEGFKAFAGIDRVKGFAMGRSIFGDPARQWLAANIDDAQLIAQVSKRYAQVIEHWESRGSGYLKLQPVAINTCNPLARLA